MSRHSKRTKPNRRNSHQRSEAKVARRKARVAKGRTKKPAVTFKGAMRAGGVQPINFIGGVPQHSAGARTRSMLGLR